MDRSGSARILVTPGVDVVSVLVVDRARRRGLVGGAGVHAARRVVAERDHELAGPVALDPAPARRPGRSLESVLLLNGHPRHPPASGGKRIAGAGELLTNSFSRAASHSCRATMVGMSIAVPPP
jgi:hypothetical protein